jgi:hypothetical protein
MGSEKLERINPALVDKMIRTEDAVSRGRAELAKQHLLRPERASSAAATTAEVLPPRDSWLAAGVWMAFVGAAIFLADLWGYSISILSWLGGLERPFGVALALAGVAVVASRLVAGVPLSRLWRNSEAQQRKAARPAKR